MQAPLDNPQAPLPPHGGRRTNAFWLTGHVAVTLLFVTLSFVMNRELDLKLSHAQAAFTGQGSDALSHFMLGSHTGISVVTQGFLVIFYLFLTLAWTGFRREEELKLKNRTIAAQIDQRDAFEQRMKTHIQDVQKAHERAMRAIDEAEKANLAKSEFLASMSHELRTPMNGIIGMAGMLEGTPLNQEQKEYASLIIRSATSLLAILNDILDLSKIEAGGVELEKVPFPLSRAIIGTMELFVPLANEKGLALEMDLGRTLPRSVEGDEGRIIQVLRNLLGNAIKFTQKGAIRITARRDDSDIFFSVSDTGIGIPPDQRTRIFEKFTQANNTSTRKFGGTGLGLAICKQLVELMGGKIGVDSDLGNGSIFWFRLPLKECADNDRDVDTYKIGNTHSNLQEEQMNRDAKILLAEDHPTNQFLVKKILTKNGFTHLDIVENGREAVEAYNIGNYDLVLMDGMMPEMDGYEATRIIRASARDKRRRVPIIAMTANAMVGDREKCLEAGMDDYISKPVDAAKFMKLMAKWAPSIEGALPVLPETNPDNAQEHAGGPVNVVHLESFTDGDREVEKELFEIFVDQMGLGLASLEAFVDDDRAADWKSAAHRFKGAAANLGAEKLAALCAEAEQAFGQPGTVKKTLLAAINAEADIVQGFIEERLG